MKRVVFVITHLCSGSPRLIEALNSSDRVHIHTTHNMYFHPEDLNALTDLPHKCRTAAAIYGDQLFYNISFQCKRLYDWCDFIYLIRGGKDTLLELAVNEPYNDLTSYRYYCYRLRRVYEMAKRTPKATLITWNDLKTGEALPELEDFLCLKKKLPRFEIERSPFRTDIDPKLINKAQDCFEYYLYKLKTLPNLSD